MTNYQKFQSPNYNGDGLELTSSSSVDDQMPFLEPPKRELSSLLRLRRLIWVQFSMALAMICLQSIIDIVAFKSNISVLPIIGMGNWVGIFGVITARLGFDAFRTPYGNKCTMIANFVMSILGNFGDAAVIIFTCACLAFLESYVKGNARGEQLPSDDMIRLARGLMMAESLLLLAAITHVFSSIVSTAFICGNLCCKGREPPVTVVVYPRGSDPSHIVAPPGTRLQHYVVAPQQSA